MPWDAKILYKRKWGIHKDFWTTKLYIINSHFLAEPNPLAVAPTSCSKSHLLICSGVKKHRMSTGSDIVAETSSNSGTFKKGSTRIAPPPLVQIDEDITTLDTLKPASSPSYKSSPTWIVCSVRIQPTAVHSNDDISLIYNVQIMCSWMRWKPEDETLLFVQVINSRPQGFVKNTRRQYNFFSVSRRTLGVVE